MSQYIHSSGLGDEGIVNVHWLHDSHEHSGYIDLKWLKEHSYSGAILDQLHQQSKPLFAVSLEWQFILEQLCINFTDVGFTSQDSMPQISCSEVVKGEQEVWK